MLMDYLRERRFGVSRPNLSAFKPLNTAKALVFTDEFNDWGCTGVVAFDGRFPLKIIKFNNNTSMPRMFFYYIFQI